MTGAIWAPGSRASTAPDRFPYARFHADLVGPAAALAAGDRAADHAALELAYRTRSLVLRQVQPIQHLTLEIIDYPGEWLLDLPLLEQGFAQFSHEALGLAEQPLRRAAAAGWLDAAGRLRPDGPEDEDAITAVSDAYPPLPAALPQGAWPEPGPARPVHQSRRPGRLGAAALLPAAAGRAAPRHQPGAHGRALRALPRGGGAALLRGPFQPLRPAGRAGRPAGRAECRPGAFRRHPGDRWR